VHVTQAPQQRSRTDRAKERLVSFQVVDGYLLGQPISKAEVVSALLGDRSSDPAAAPFYRALEAVGVRAADEAFVALRLILAGRSPEDVAVRRLRALSGIARACVRADRAGLALLVKREQSTLRDLAVQPAEDLVALAAAAVAAYHAALTPRSGR